MLVPADFKTIASKLNSDTPEDDVVELVQAVKNTPLQNRLLVPLLAERHRLYKDRGANQVSRLRGYILSTFELSGLPDEALIYVLDELENSRNAYVVAAAAKALRGLKHPTAQVVSYLFKAVANIRHMDDAVTFETYKPQWPLKNYTSALKEIFTTFQWLGAYAKGAINELKALIDENALPLSAEIKLEVQKAIKCIQEDEREVSNCCEVPLTNADVVKSRVTSEQIADMALEDQNGKSLTYRTFFKGLPSVVAFFYTRCNNPNKCSLTVAKMGQLQRVLDAEGLYGKVRTAVITYDPGYDNPARLKAYAENRGLNFNENNRAFRVKMEDFADFSSYFKLGVNYSGSIVNQHRVELFVLDKHGNVVKSFTRLQWDNDEVINSAKDLLNDSNEPFVPQRSFKTDAAKVLNSVWSVLPPLFVAFFPKCPVCWAAYLSMFGITGLNSIPYSPWLVPVFVAIIGVNLWALAKGAKNRNGLLPFYLSLTGALFLIVPGLLLKVQAGLYTGISLIFAGSLLNSLSFKTYIHLRSNLNYYFAKLNLKNG